MSRSLTSLKALAGGERSESVSALATFGAITSGSLLVRLVEDEADRDAAHALRYRVFYEEMSATANPLAAPTRRDRDAFDDYCDHPAPPVLRPRAVDHRYTSMNLLAKEEIDVKSVALPPLIKGYLRLGGYVGDGAVIDRQFNATDVCVVVKTDGMSGKYFRHYARDRDVAGPAPGLSRN